MAWVPARSCRASFEAFEAWQTAGLNALNNRGQWPECLLEAAAQRFRHLRPGKRQAWTPLATEGSGGSACPKLPRSVLGGKRQAWTPLTTEGSGLSACSQHAWTPLTNRGQWPECLAEGKVVASQQKQAPHLRWSQAPPLPWRRPGSADIYIYIFI